MDQLYFESGYIETNYFTILKDTGSAITVTATMTAAVDIANTANYFIPDYIEEGYFQAPEYECWDIGFINKCNFVVALFAFLPHMSAHNRWKNETFL